MFRMLVAAAVVFSCGLCLADTIDSKYAEVPDIKSLHALRQQKPVATVDGHEIRLGVTQAAEGCPWAIVYCHMKYIGQPGKQSINLPANKDDEEILGPLVIQIESKRTQESMEEIKEIACKSIQRAQRTISGQEVVFCRLVPLEGGREYRVIIMKADGHGLAEKTLKPDYDAGSAWFKLLKEEQNDADRAACRMDDSSAIHVPVLQGSEPVWTAGDKLDLPKPDKDGKGFLPAAWPTTSPADDPQKQPGLKLSMKNDEMVIDSQFGLDSALEEHLLVRWWVNGKPVPAQPAAKEAEDQIKRAAEMLKEIKQAKVRFVVPQYVGDLAEGDKLTVQVMYCSKGIERFWQVKELKKMMQLDRLCPASDCGLMLSNKLEIKVTAGKTGAPPATQPSIKPVKHPAEE